MGVSDGPALSSKFREDEMLADSPPPPAYSERGRRSTRRAEDYDDDDGDYNRDNRGNRGRSSQDTAYEDSPDEVNSRDKGDRAKRETTEEAAKSFWQRCKDKWAFVAFLVNLLVYNILAVYGIYSFMTDYKKEVDDLSELKVEGEGDLSKALTEETAWIFAGATGLGISLSFALLFFVRIFPAFVIWSGPVLCTTMLFAAAAVWSFAGGCAFAGAILLASLWLLKGRYFLARDLLDTANRAARAHWSVFWTVMIDSHPDIELARTAFALIK
ncbi:hypothetical protein I316_07115 [Kwoniella heveanensis BCC8398]|uniref:Protein PNS1 n=1 Tax=Kwoniella heveanensis BCC8398 TaxID=1296120 RepID=A0A1B9GJG5_9TREE|nr:hypothetical protein I316_07115 [Kwoniella heveanensis BCC8398]